MRNLTVAAVACLISLSTNAQDAKTEHPQERKETLNPIVNLDRIEADQKRADAQYERLKQESASRPKSAEPQKSAPKPAEPSRGSRQ